MYALPSLELSTIVGVLFTSFFLLFSGFNPPGAAIPTAYKWCYYSSPHRLTLSVLVALLFGECDENVIYSGEGIETRANNIGCQTLQNAPLTLGDITVKTYINQVYNIAYNDIQSHMGYILVYIFVLRILSLLSLRYVNHQKR